jgi:hypothetical protein
MTTSNADDSAGLASRCACPHINTTTCTTVARRHENAPAGLARISGRTGAEESTGTVATGAGANSKGNRTSATFACVAGLEHDRTRITALSDAGTDTYNAALAS